MKPILQRFLVTVMVFAITAAAAMASTDERDASKPDVKPRRIILLIIDGMAIEVPERFEMDNLRELIRAGTLFKAMVLPPPAHPQDDPNYPWSCSLPNPMLMAGTGFVGQPDIRENMIQHQFPDATTAFVANARSYHDVSGGFDHYLSFPHKPDALVTEQALDVIDQHDPILMRVHYQRPGIEGMKSIRNRYRDEPWYHNVWHPDAPYRKANLEADRQLGLFIDGLKARSKWQDTLLLICGDHGQADEGWHEPTAKGSSQTPLVIVGPGVKAGQVFEHCTIFDIAPTIAWAAGRSSPSLSHGRPLSEAWHGTSQTSQAESVKRLNQALLDFEALDPDSKKQAQQRGFLPLAEVSKWHTTAAGKDWEKFVDQQVLALNPE